MACPYFERVRLPQANAWVSWHFLTTSLVVYHKQSEMGLICSGGAALDIPVRD